jgi:cell division transport system ATP-binding protein
MELKNTTIAYGPKKVLKNINLSIENGDFVFLIGNSGSGKSSFIKTLIGDLRPQE